MKFDRTHSFEYATAEQVAPELVRITARNPGVMTFHGTGTYLVGRRRGAVIDPGPKLEEHRLAVAAAVEEGELEHILVTHRHQDHAGLAKALSSSTEVPVSAFDSEPEAAVGQVEGEKPEVGFMPDVPMEDGDVIEGAGFTLEALHTPGHTGDHLCFVDHEHRRVFCGDHIMAWSTTVIIPPDGHVGRYLESLERLLEFARYTFWPTHGPPIRDAGRFIRGLIEHRRQRERQLVDALACGPATVDSLVEVIYGGLDPRLLRAARQSLLAGLFWLMEQQRATCEDPGAEWPRYRLLSSAGRAAPASRRS